MTAADRPSVTDDARAEADRRWGDRRTSDRLPSDWLDEGMASGFVLGAQWAAGRAETTTSVIHLSNPDDGASFCDQPVTIITEAGDTRPMCQTCHRGAMKHAHRRAETTTATTEDAARVLYESGTGFKLTKGKPWEELTESSRNSQRRLAQALADAGLHATARTRPTDTTKETS